MLVENFDEAFFSSNYWQENNAVVGTAQGRGTTWFIEHDAQSWVLKHYYRGGLIGRLLNDSYFYNGLANTRSVAEFMLLAQLNAFELPTPKAVACAVYRHGFTYQADIITSRIPNAQDLVSLLSQQTIDKSLYQKIGKTIKQFHDKGVFHHDLNIHNILIDDAEQVWVIDFDRGKLLPPHIRWQHANIERLKRSFLKEQKKISDFNFQLSAFSHLLLGYNTA